MIKKIILTSILLSFGIYVFAEDINMTPQRTFSGFTNSGVRSQYPHLKQSVSADDVLEEQYEKQNDFMKPMSVRRMRNAAPPSNDGKTPMTYEQFPKNYDSSNSIMLMQGGMNNMFMGL